MRRFGSECANSSGRLLPTSTPWRSHATSVAGPRNRSKSSLQIDEQRQAIGFIELSIRAYAEGCKTDRVAFVEGWYVDPAARSSGVGRTLIDAAETWGRSQGCVELGSDAEVDNLGSAAAHRAVGFRETGVVRCFLKSL